MAPGFISIVANYLAKQFDTIDTVHMRVGALPQFPTNALKYNLTWSTAGLINEYCNPCEVIYDGQLRQSGRILAGVVRAGAGRIELQELQAALPAAGFDGVVQVHSRVDADVQQVGKYERVMGFQIVDRAKDMVNISGLKVYTTYVDEVLWASTYFGLSRYDGRHWRGYYESETGLPSDFGNAVAGRSAHEAWYCTDKGLAVVTDFPSDTWVTYLMDPNTHRGRAVVQRGDIDPDRAADDPGRIGDRDAHL